MLVNLNESYTVQSNEYFRWHALALTSKGFTVFRCKPKDKTPLAIGWQNEATTDEKRIIELWNETPTANIGIPTGKVNKLIVLDVDPKNGGFESLADLEKRHGKLPSTMTVTTGSGGLHYYFFYAGDDIRNSAGKLGPGLDIRGEGGYVVAPPSIHPNGNHYKFQGEL